MNDCADLIAPSRCSATIPGRIPRPYCEAAAVSTPQVRKSACPPEEIPR
jgi:hypothetical protein